MCWFKRNHGDLDYRVQFATRRQQTLYPTRRLTLSVITTHRWHRRASPALAWTEHTVGTFAVADWVIAD